MYKLSLIYKITPLSTQRKGLVNLVRGREDFVDLQYICTVSPPAESLSSSLARIPFLSLSRKGTYCMLSSLKIICRAGKSRDTIPKDVSWSWNSFFVNLFISSLLRQRQTHTVCTQYNVSRPAMSAVTKIIRRQHDFESEQFFVKKTVVPNLQSRFVQWLLC